MAIDPSEIRLTPEQREFVADRAQQAGKSWNELLGELVPVQVPGSEANGRSDNGESAFDVARRLGLVDAGTDGPSDLATNPIHMEGFGESDHNTSSD